MQFSFIIPVLNEAPRLQARLRALQALRAAGHELILVDGGSRDGSVELARPLADKLLPGNKGRAVQMNAGAAVATGEVLVFLHIDTELPEEGVEVLQAALVCSPRKWGWFRVSLDNPGWIYRLIAWSMNQRARLTNVCTGDQCLFVRRQEFSAIGGFPDLPLMEDVAISKLLRRSGPPLIMPVRVKTSARRWETGGVLRTILFMWQLRLLYFLGVDPAKLAKRYYPEA